MKRSFHLTWHKLTHWEYWPFQLIYIPIYGLWLFYAIRLRSLFFFNAVNPSIKNGGFVMDSKKKVYDLIPPQHYPKTTLIRANTSQKELGNILRKEALTYPLIAKPDIGLRGSGVKKINNLSDLLQYTAKATFNFILQDYIDLPKEMGIFYIRYPHSLKGQITGIVAKEFLSITGDGQSTIEEIINKTPRFQLQLQGIRKEYSGNLNHILRTGEKVVLLPYGSHARGAKFTDISDVVSPDLTEMINAICLQVKGFYYGRLDIMYNTLSQLERGENFKIVEINGAKSEPTHIYDPKHSLLFAWKELARHITYMYRISKANHQQKGVPYLDYKDGIRQIYEHHQQVRKIMTV